MKVYEVLTNNLKPGMKVVAGKLVVVDGEDCFEEVARWVVGEPENAIGNFGKNWVNAHATRLTVCEEYTAFYEEDNIYQLVFFDRFD